MTTPEGTPHPIPMEPPPDAPSDPQWVSLKEAAPLARVSVKTARRWATSGKVVAEMVDGRWMIRRDSLPEGPPPSAEPTPPPAPSVPEGAMLVPLSAWEGMMRQLANIHEAGQELAEAKERAARAEERERFQTERRNLLEQENAELKAQLASRPLPDLAGETVEEVAGDLEEMRSHPKPWWRRIRFELPGRQR